MQTIEVKLWDDIDGVGTPATLTVTFSYLGTTYEIDLSEEHYQELEASLAPFIKNARKGSTKAKIGRPAKPVAPGERNVPAMRTWAIANGWELGKYTRIPADAEAAYYAAHKA